MPTIAISLLCAISIGLYARSKRRNPFLWGILGFIPHPYIRIAVIVALLALPPAPAQSRRQSSSPNLNAENARRRAEGLAEIEDV